MKRFLLPEHKAQDNEVIVSYTIKPAGKVTFHEALHQLASSLRLNISSRNHSGDYPIIFAISQETFQCQVAFPEDLFEPANIPQHQAIIAGSLLDTAFSSSIRIDSISWTDKLIVAFPGPHSGLEGLRNQTGIHGRPFSSVLLLPPAGCNTKELLEKAYHSWMGGCDIVQDSSMTCSTENNDFYERVNYLSKEQLNCSKRTQQSKIYIPNITAPTLLETEHRAKKAKEAGISHVMINGPQVGWLGIASLRQICKDLGLGLCSSFDGQALHQSGQAYQISLPLQAQIARLLGIDLFSIRLPGEEQTSSAIIHSLTEEHSKRFQHQLRSTPVCTEVSTGQIQELVKDHGNDLILQAGESVCFHPDGVKAGAEAFQLAVLSASQGISQKERGPRSSTTKKSPSQGEEILMS